jgi:ribosomal-protein-alanine N-acetyltransferase
MQAEDLPVVMKIESEHDFPWTETMLRDCLSVSYENYVLEKEKKIIGFGILSIATSECEILNIAIATDHRRQGLGFFLLEHLLDFARQRGVRKAYLEVRISNTAALKLYERAGFKAQGLRKGYYPAAEGKREDAVILGCDIMPGP